MLIAHDLLLLVLDDETGKTVSWLSQPDKALAGAVLIDLAARGHIDIDDDGKLTVRGSGAPTEPVLGRGLDLVRDKEGKKPDSVLGPLAKDLRDELADELVAAGILRREERKVLGLFRTERLPSADDSYESQLRAQIVQVLSGTAAPDARTGPVIALLHAMDALSQVFELEDKKAAKARAKEIAEGEWADDVVRASVKAVQSAVFYAVLAGPGGAAAGASG